MAAAAFVKCKNHRNALAQHCICRYVLLKERNMLASEQMRRKARGEKLPNPSRTTKVRNQVSSCCNLWEQDAFMGAFCQNILLMWVQVRKSMARIKLVLSERAIAMPDPVQSQAMRAMINS